MKMEGTLKEILAQGPKFEENILKAFENRKLVFFIGAGVSRIMGIMGWEDFSAFLIKHAFPDFKDYSAVLRDVPSSKERITIAYKKFEQEDRLDEFYQYFGQGMTPNQKVFESKENIYKILNRFEAIFLTTNADNLFEEVIGSALCHENYKLDILKSESQRRQNHLFYLHGHYTENIDPVKNNLVFTAPQYVERYNDKDFTQFLKTIFEDGNTIVFIGYGLNEFELIDYVITKAGHTSNSCENVYVLYPFCENDDLLFEVKKSYFKAINIEIIPYDISKNGYDSLINVLNALYDDYQKKTIVPVTETISDCIADFNDTNYTSIKRFLTDPNLAPTTEVQITREIQKTGNFNWVEHFYKDGLYSQEQMDIKIAYGAWPLLELFTDWVKSDHSNAQKAASTFLKQINAKQIKALQESHSFIHKDITQITFALEKNYIQQQHLDLLIEISRNSDLFGLRLEKIPTFHRVISWDWKLIQKLFDWLFDGVEIDSFKDGKAYIIDLFFKQFNETVSDNHVLINTYEYFKDMIVNASSPDKYNLFQDVHDVDNIYKNHKEYWKIILTELNFTFSKLTSDKQIELLQEAMSNDAVAVKKLGLYLARKHNLDISHFIVNSDLFKHYPLYHECYLLLKHHIENKYLTAEAQNRLLDIILEAKFEIDTYKNLSPEDTIRFEKLILSKRLALLLLFSNIKSQTAIAELKSKSINPYPTTTIADGCDYVHAAKWENAVPMDKEIFDNIPYDKWIEKLNELCVGVDNISAADCGEKFVQLLLTLNDDQLAVIFPTLKNLSPSLLSPVLHKLDINKKKFNSHMALINSCLDILQDVIKQTPLDKEVANTIFSFLSEIDIQDGEVIQKMLTAINPWLYISINGDPAFVGEKNILINLINYGDFNKFGTLLNCYVSRKTLLGDELTDKECTELLDLLSRDNDDKTFRYTMCYYYQQLKYLSSDKAVKIFESIFNETPVDMTALILCTLNSGYLFKEVVEKIESSYLLGSTSIPDECKERVMSDRFYSYIVSAHYENSITTKTFEKAYTDRGFVEYFLRSLSMWAEKENFDAEKWLIPCWNHIRVKYTGEQLQEFARLLLHSVDDIKVHTEPLLDMYIDVSAYCSQKYSVHISPTKLLPFFNISKSKSDTLLRYILDNRGFVVISELEEIIHKYKDNNLSREGRELLIMLASNGEISNQEKERLAKLLD